MHCGATGLGGRETGAVSAPCPFNPASPPIKTPGSAALGPQLLPSEHSHDPRQLTSSRKGLAANARDKPRDMFTASGGTERTDIHMVSLGGWKGLCKSCLGFPGSSVVKSLPANAGDRGLIPGSGRSPGGLNGNTLQYACLGNSMDRGAWQATVHGVSRVGHDLATKQELDRGHLNLGDLEV